jgi:hypothetical protein
MRTFPSVVVSSFCVIAAAVACGPTTGTPLPGGNTPTDAGNTVTPDSGSMTPDSGSSGTPDAGPMGDAGCDLNCASANPAAYQKFNTDLLNACGCTASQACSASCTSECTNPSAPVDPGSACGQCLASQEGLGQNSSCVSSGATNCLLDSTCSPFVSCAMNCPM